MYATQPDEVLAYAANNGVSHFLVNVSRYQSDFVRKSVTFEPLTTFARNLLRDANVEKFIFAHPPDAAVIYSHREYRLLSVEKLRELWSAP
jgi:hypothetical protein